ncbi:MAG: heavy metal-associated domain-containing protein [bacterium]|nr:heavy metal-associated domain-containing protein [bacterium]
MSGMHCESCAKIINMKLGKEKGVAQVYVDYSKNQAVISFDPDQTNATNFVNLIADLGYLAKEA